MRPDGVLPFYLGDDVLHSRHGTVAGCALAAGGDGAQISRQGAGKGKLTRYVTESGYEEFEKERLRVGRNPPAPQSLVLLNLVDHTRARALDRTICRGFTTIH